jgi:HEPN domain-containing protein
MKQATCDWVKKAEEDYLAAFYLARRRKRRLHNTVCFHCQQSAEKYLKARIEEAGLRIPRSHDLESLLNILL